MRWNLEKMFESDRKALEVAEGAVNRLEQLIGEFERTTEPARVVDALKQIEKIGDDLGAAIQYAWMKYSVETDSQETQKLLGRIEQLQARAHEKYSIMEVHLASLADESLKRITEIDDNYEHFISKIVEQRKHLLSRDAERIMSLTSQVRRDAVSKLHSRLESSYRFRMVIDGEERELTTEQMKSLRHSPDGQLRKNAMETLLRRFAQDSIVFAETYNIIVKDFALESKLRNFPRPISMRNLDNEIADSVVDKVVEITSDSTEILRKYYRWKSRYLGEVLTPADVYAPVGERIRKFDFGEAKRVVLDAYYAFDETAGRIVEEFFEEERIDLYPRPSKVSGAYCIYFTSHFPPYVLTNYNGNVTDVTTLAHELGHGLHGRLSMAQTYFNRRTPLTLSEIASVFGEFLVFDRLKSELAGQERVALIAKKLEEIFATTFRQNTFTKFELGAFDTIEREGYMSWEELSDLYGSELRAMFGDAVEVPEWYRYEWAFVSHFFETPFYVYAYNVAHCVVIALYRMYLEYGKKFAKDYLSLLSEGGKHSPDKLLAKVGLQMNSDELWMEAFRYIGEMVDELIEITANK